MADDTDIKNPPPSPPPPDGAAEPEKAAHAEGGTFAEPAKPKPAKPDAPDCSTPAWVEQEPFVPAPAATLQPRVRTISGTIETRAPDPVKPERKPEPRSAPPSEPKRSEPPRSEPPTGEPRRGEPPHREPAASEPRRGEPRAPRPADSGSDFGSDFDDKTDPGHRRRYWGLLGWGWVLVVVVGIAVLLLVFDIRNRDRFLMVCKANAVELHRGRTFPWPFGHEAVGGPEFQPVEIPSEADCRTRVFDSQEEGELGFLDFIMSQVQTALANPGTADLERARRHVLQALLLARTHRTRRKDAEKMLAELAYREGRAGLARVENELRTALARFQEAQRLDGERFEDLDDWIAHLEQLLRTVSPSPGSTAPGFAAPGFTLPAPGTASTLRNPVPGLPLPTLPPASAPVITAPDAGSPQSGGGILM